MDQAARAARHRSARVREVAGLVAIVVLAASACATRVEPSPARVDPTVKSVGAPGTLEVSGQAGRKMTVTIEDDGILESWRSATKDELRAHDAALGGRDIALIELGDGNALLIWSGSACDRSGTLRATPDSITVLPDPRPGCDAVSNPRGMVVTFRPEIDPTGLALTLGAETVVPEAP